MVTSNRAWKSNFLLEVTNLLRAMEARLHTATCSHTVWRVLSLPVQHRERQKSYLLRAGVLHYLSTEVTTFDGSQVLQVWGEEMCDSDE